MVVYGNQTSSATSSNVGSGPRQRIMEVSHVTVVYLNVLSVVVRVGCVVFRKTVVTDEQKSHLQSQVKKWEFGFLCCVFLSFLLLSLFDFADKFRIFVIIFSFSSAKRMASNEWLPIHTYLTVSTK